MTEADLITLKQACGLYPRAKFTVSTLRAASLEPTSPIEFLPRQWLPEKRTRELPARFSRTAYV